MGGDSYIRVLPDNYTGAEATAFCSKVSTTKLTMTAEH